MDKSVAARFWAKVDLRELEPGSCWEWTGTKVGGYGRFFPERRRGVLAHRLAYETEVSPIPEGLLVRHRCDNPACVNPAHLEVGTHVDNARDRDVRGRNGYSKRTHCPQGHPFDEANTYWWRDTRRCRACGAQRSREHYARQKKKPK